LSLSTARRNPSTPAIRREMIPAAIPMLQRFDPEAAQRI
jgi:hypothetical protein